MTTIVLGIVLAGGLVAAFGWLMRGRRLTCHRDGGCASLTTGSCTSCNGSLPAEIIRHDHQ